jgi:hypothetical protein
MAKQTTKRAGVDEKPAANEIATKPDPVKPAKPVPKWRQCPLCFGNYGGVGKITCTRGMRRYYVCTTCGFHWHADMEYRTLEFTTPTPGEE